MMRAFIAILVCVIWPVCGVAGEFTTAVVRAALMGKAIGLATSNDVPAEWRLSHKTVDEGAYRTTTFSRGSNAVMQLRWKPAWTNDKQCYFTGAILDGTTRVAKLLGSPGTVGVWPLASPQQYSVLTFASRTTNSAVTVDGTNGFREMYMIDGRNTAPLNEVDYTKMRFFEDFAWKPLVETITNQSENTSPTHQPGR